MRPYTAPQKWLALDAMGVLFVEHDDLRNTLIPPYVQARNAAALYDEIDRLYRRLFLGEMTSCEFWRAVGLPEDSDADYLPLLEPDSSFNAVADGWPLSLKLGLISNHAAAWGRQLLAGHGLAPRLSAVAISGECGVRKPDAGIYERFLELSGADPADCLFVDDRAANLAAAHEMGFSVILFDRAGTKEWDGPKARSFAELTAPLLAWLGT